MHDGDGMGVWVRPYGEGEAIGEAPLACRRRRKFWGESVVLLNFEWFLSGWAMGHQVEYCGKVTPVFRITDVLPYSTFTGLLPGVREV